MAATRDTGLLADAPWSGRIFNGTWAPSTGGIGRVTEPATGETLAEVGLGNARHRHRGAHGGRDPARLGGDPTAREGPHPA